MKKYLLLVISILSVFFLICGCSAVENDDSVLTWNTEKSGFSEYSIENNKVYFDYKICFENHSEENLTISVCAIFKPKELKGWVKENDLSNKFFAVDENENIARYSIPAKSEETVTLKFVGEYLGGTVNKNLSFPEELMIEFLSEDEILND